MFTETFSAAVAAVCDAPLSSVRREMETIWAQWNTADRGYHDGLHLREVLDRLEELGHPDPSCVLAAWFHDVVYTGTPGDDECASAATADRTLRNLGAPDEVCTAVVNLVLMTMNHEPSGDPHEQALADADLAILAASPQRYAEYLVALRADFPQYDDAAFRAGRRAFVSDLLARPTIFHTDHGRRVWEPLARANLQAELDPSSTAAVHHHG